MNPKLVFFFSLDQNVGAHPGDVILQVPSAPIQPPLSGLLQGLLSCLESQHTQQFFFGK